MTLTQVDQQNAYRLGSPGGEIGQILLNSDYSQTGIFWLAPSGNSDLINVDINPDQDGIQPVDASSQPGWQGHLEFTYQVGPNFVTQDIVVQAGAGPLSNTGLDMSRVAAERSTPFELSERGWRRGTLVDPDRS